MLPCETLYEMNQKVIEEEILCYLKKYTFLYHYLIKGYTQNKGDSTHMLREKNEKLFYYLEFQFYFNRKS